ncbi:MAG: beta-mannosidase, partial [Alphaproteobacteria bacterium]
MQKINKNWQLAGNGLNTDLSCDLPMDVFSVLENNNVIPNPYYGRNEYDVRWVGEQDWQLSCSFTPNGDILEKRHQWLSIERLDTCADITLNGNELAHVCNMHTKHIFDVTGKLKDDNMLKVILKDNVAEAAKRAKALPFPIPYSGGHNNQVPHMNLIRKTHCHAGWDWGIMLLTSGIYGDVILEGDNNARLCAVTAEQHHKDGKVEVIFSVHFDVYSAGEREIHYTFAGTNYNHKIRLQKGKQIIRLQPIKLDNPKLWWPVGYGGQPLYDFEASFGSQSITQKIGLRTIEVISEKDEYGQSFLVKVNGQTIFCKGANWIPMDAKPSTHNAKRYERLLKDAKAAHMNMIRIWGGGQYEADTFYEICDQEGILIWHDLMFACALYPSFDWFTKEVKDELEYQIPRMQHHASIALWCGDNEVIGAINWFEISRNNRDTYLANYDRFNYFCGQLVTKLDPTRRFWPSSPSAGDLDFGDAFHDPSSGDMHYWEVWHEGKNLDAYKDIQPRFCSEFGFQSFPSFAEVKQFCPPSHYNVTSPTMDSHQKNNRGNSIIVEMFTRYFRMPKNFEYQLWLSQTQQAIAIQNAVNFWRASMPICMGTLYWQLNDNWPVSSWSSIQYSGRWRLLHYLAKRFYAPLSFNIVTTDDEVTVNALCDHPNGGNIQGTLTLYSLSGEKLEQWPLAKEFSTAGADAVLTLRIKDFDAGKQQSFLALEFENQDGKQLECAFMVRPKSLDLPDADIQYQIKGQQIELTTDKPAFYVSLEAENTSKPFGDNLIFLLPNQPRLIDLPQDFDEKSLKIYHLADS